LPEGEDEAPDFHLDLVPFLLGFGHAVALVEQGGDLVEGIQDAAALDFGRVGGEDRRHVGGVEEIPEFWRVEPGGAGAGKAGGKAAFAGRGAGDEMGAPAAGVVMVFRNIGQDREIAEGAGDFVDLLFREAGQDILQLRLRGKILIPMEADGELANALDLLIGFVTIKGANGFA
jgi:hypothetical protein